MAISLIVARLRRFNYHDTTMLTDRRVVRVPEDRTAGDRYTARRGELPHKSPEIFGSRQVYTAPETAAPATA